MRLTNACIIIIIIFDHCHGNIEVRLDSFNVERYVHLSSAVWNTSFSDSPWLMQIPEVKPSFHGASSDSLSSTLPCKQMFGSHWGSIRQTWPKHRRCLVNLLIMSSLTFNASLMSALVCSPFWRLPKFFLRQSISSAHRLLRESAITVYTVHKYTEHQRFIYFNFGCCCYASTASPVLPNINVKTCQQKWSVLFYVWFIALTPYFDWTWCRVWYGMLQ